MTLRVEVVAPAAEGDYGAVARHAPEALLYASPSYAAFLSRVLRDSEPRYLVAYDGATPVGALPAYLMRNAAIGPVLNSLPFYGSNGGPFISAAVEDPTTVQRALVDAFVRVAEQSNAVSATLISSPLDPLHAELPTLMPHTHRDSRIGQLTMLPAGGGDVEEALMALFHQKTRNAIRKAQKSGFALGHDGSETTLRTLAMLHTENITAIGGLAKPWAVFAAIAASFAYDVDYRVYTATTHDGIVSALLVFYVNGVAEYFTPATREDYRSLQPMSLLILKAMEEAVRRGCRAWNWGGTWTSQAGVYQFKSRWGTTDLPYYYYTLLRDPALLELTRGTLLEQYPYYFVLPFSELRG